MSIRAYAMAVLWCARRLGQSVLLLVLFWVALDLLQTHAVTKPTNTVLMTQTVNPRGYGYFTHKEIEKAPIIKRVVKRKRPAKIAPPVEVQVHNIYCDARGPECPRPRKLS
jgi:hypothetical protein